MLRKQSRTYPQHLRQYHELIVKAVREADPPVIGLIKFIYFPLVLDVTTDREVDVFKIWQWTMVNFWFSDRREKLYDIQELEVYLFSILLEKLEGQPKEAMLNHASKLRDSLEATRREWGVVFETIIAKRQQCFDYECFNNGNFRRYCHVLGVLFPWLFMKSYNANKSIDKSLHEAYNTLDPLLANIGHYYSWQTVVEYLEQNTLYFKAV